MFSIQFWKKKEEGFSQEAVEFLISRILEDTVDRCTMLEIFDWLRPVIGDAVVRQCYERLNPDDKIRDAAKKVKWIKHIKGLRKQGVM